MFPVEAMEEEVGVEPAGAALNDGGGALLVISFLGVAVEVEGGIMVRVERARLVQDVFRPVEKLVREAYRFCTSRLNLNGLNFFV